MFKISVGFTSSKITVTRYVDAIPRQGECLSLNGHWYDVIKVGIQGLEKENEPYSFSAFVILEDTKP